MKKSRILSKKDREKYCFKKGYMQIRKCDVVCFRRECMKLLGISTFTAFYNRMEAKVIPNMYEYDQLTALFKKYGVEDAFGN